MEKLKIEWEGVTARIASPQEFAKEIDWEDIHRQAGSIAKFASQVDNKKLIETAIRNQFAEWKYKIEGLSGIEDIVRTTNVRMIKDIQKTESAVYDKRSEDVETKREIKKEGLFRWFSE